jgi:beta-xylosidase
MTKAATIRWDHIDPSVYIDEKGQTWLFWGNTACYYAKLKDNMIELDGEIKTISLPKFTEAPWIHKRNGWYYLSYAMSRSIEGPWEYKGFLNEIAGNFNTNHQAIMEFKGKWYFIYHNGALVPDAGSFHRSVCIDYLQYNNDGTMKRVAMTSDDVPPAK